VRKILPQPGFDPRTFQPGSSVAIPTEPPGPRLAKLNTFFKGVAVENKICKIKFPDNGMEMSKHVAVWIIQRDCCDIHFYDINCTPVGYNIKNNKRCTVHVLKT
jgi:hypothetical protein